MKHIIVLLFTILLHFTCTRVNGPNGSEQLGQLNIFVWMNGSRSLNRMTVAEKVIVTLSKGAENIASDTADISAGDHYTSFKIANIHADTLQVSAFTTNLDGDTVHASVSKELIVQAGLENSVTLELSPIVGSICLSLNEIPSRVDSLFFTFETVLKKFESKAKRSSKLFLSLDMIRYGSVGDISVAGLSSNKDTVISWRKEGFLFDKKNVTIDASFINVGSPVISVTVSDPFITQIVGIGDTTSALLPESANPDSSIIISEIMYSGGSGASSCDYIEIFNSSVRYDSLFFPKIVLNIGGDFTVLEDVGIKAGEYYTVGAGGIPDPSMWNIDKTEDVDLISTGGILEIRREDGSVMDRICFESGGVLGWPKVSASAKTSVVLKSENATSDGNNYGTSWVKAEHFIDTLFKGTPGLGGF